MSGYKKRQQELRSIDRFQKALIPYIRWIEQNPKILIQGAGGVLFLLLIGFGVQYWNQKQEAQRADLLGVIDGVYDREQKKAGEAQQALAEQVKPLKDKKDPTPEESQKIKSLEEQITQVKPDHTGSLEQYSQYFRQNPSLPEGWRAGMTAAKILIDQLSYEKATEILKEVLKASQSDSFYQAQGTYLIVSLLEELGRHDEALAQIEEIAKKTALDEVPKILYVKARLLLTGQKEKEGVQVLDTLIQDHNSSTYAQKAQALRALYPSLLSQPS